MDAVTAGHSDIDLMIALLNWVCDNFAHNGNSGVPYDRDIISIINFSKENTGGLNCRLLAIMLAELLRLYGIEAKHITAHPIEDSFVHVVTHAYSRKYNQWIMLDPTFRLYLKNGNGNYMDLAELRDSFIDNEEIFANNNAGRNGWRFDMNSYKRFIVDYLFRFSCATNFTFGTEDGRGENHRNILVPVGFNEQTGDIITTSANAFWAAPN